MPESPTPPPPPKITESEKTPRGLARNDTLNMGEAFAKFPRPEVPPYKPPKPGKPWWKQPREER